MAKPQKQNAVKSAPAQTNVEGIPVGLADPMNDAGREAEVPASQRRNKAADKTTATPPSRFSLHMSAVMWRSLQYIGMTTHFMAPPRPPSPAFTRNIQSTLSIKHKGGKISMLFYTPEGYGKRSSTQQAYPAVVNFHGGGFVLGAGTDDARFAQFVTKTAGAVFVSVNYRLAPEYAFPTAVEDAADALLYLIYNAVDLHIDPMRLATSGFSAGGNLSLTSLLRLGEYKQTNPDALPQHRFVATTTWYPILDFTLSRAERRATCKRPDQALPSVFTDLFDASYLYPPDLDLRDNYLSPSQATDERLARDLPPLILFYTCEWDMLLQEGEYLARRLGRVPIGKDVYYKMIPDVPHGWDKSPSPLKPAPGAAETYRDCCERLKVAFEIDAEAVRSQDSEGNGSKR
ncbi:hypothetical protein SEPCBS57363_005196 [Sporothrix epigloea]|uniref:Alpha/beta hydrolase fold-3 domain-containing protein n=1 Tax=Sporothrix epigloea TaxID=1892477 RepID=A0ABP0DW96_9PEZI